MKSAIALIVLAALAPGEKKEAKLQGYDLLAAKYEAVTLQAKLERKGMLGINPDLHKVEVAFRFEGKELGRAKSAKEGIASLSWTPPNYQFKPEAQPSFEIQAALPEDSEWTSKPARFWVYFWLPERPVIVVDLDGTVCASAEWEVGLKAPADLKAIEGAPQALTELAKSHNILYLTARDDALMNATREWLDLRKFPKGPVLFRDLSLFHLSAQSYKTKRLLELKKTWNLVAGVGDREDDADAYLAAGMKAILVGKPRRAPEAAIACDSWDEVQKLLAPKTQAK